MTTAIKTLPTAAVKFSALPSIGEELNSGKFAGITTQKDGTHVAVILLPNKAESVTWDAAVEWAKKLEAELPSRSVAALIFANLKGAFDPQLCWTCDEYRESSAWCFDFKDGSQDIDRKPCEDFAVAVRLIPITA